VPRTVGEESGPIHPCRAWWENGSWRLFVKACIAVVEVLTGDFVIMIRAMMYVANQKSQCPLRYSQLRLACLCNYHSTTRETHHQPVGSLATLSWWWKAAHVWREWNIAGPSAVHRPRTTSFPDSFPVSTVTLSFRSRGKVCGDAVSCYLSDMVPGIDPSLPTGAFAPDVCRTQPKCTYDQYRRSRTVCSSWIFSELNWNDFLCCDIAQQDARTDRWRKSFEWRLRAWVNCWAWHNKVSLAPQRLV
jgi:hypothetical protein